MILCYLVYHIVIYNIAERTAHKRDNGQQKMRCIMNTGKNKTGKFQSL